MGSTDLKLCLFFQQKTKKINRKRQDLRNITTFAACEAIYSAAQIRKDKRIMLEMQPGPGLPDGIAREIMYHLSCYKKYTPPHSRLYKPI